MAAQGLIHRSYGECVLLVSLFDFLCSIYTTYYWLLHSAQFNEAWPKCCTSVNVKKLYATVVIAFALKPKLVLIQPERAKE